MAKLLIFSFYNRLMIKNIEAKSRQKLIAHNERFLNKKKTIRQIKSDQGLEHQRISKVHTEKQQQLNLQTQKPQKNKHLKPKKLKFITEQFEKSNCFLSPPCKITGHSQSLRLSATRSNHGVNNDDVYELMRASKRVQKGEGELKKRRKQSQQIDAKLISFKIAHVPKIKHRGPQSQSKDHYSVNRVAVKSNKKNKKLPKTSSQSKQSLHNKKKQFLSPEIVKQEDSYYFDSQNEEGHHSEYPGNFAEQATLMPPKRQSLLLFDSNGSVWKQNIGRSILRSTLDLLN